MGSGKLWRVVRDSPNSTTPEGYALQENDSVKLGRFKLRVRQIVTGGEPTCAHVNPSSLTPRNFDVSDANLKNLEQSPCRICLLDGSSVEDPLIKPCECKGTIEYVHLACLRHWVRGKLDLPIDPDGNNTYNGQNGNNGQGKNGTYFYRPTSCELCKTMYTTHLQNMSATEEEENDPEVDTSVRYGPKLIPLIELPKTKPPFIVLERDSNRQELKGMHVISLSEKKQLKLGRGHESGVRFADVSISRWHATVVYDGSTASRGGFVLSDHKSKFGTLVAMKTPVPLEPITTDLQLQAGRTVLWFHPKNMLMNNNENSSNNGEGDVPMSQQGGVVNQQQQQQHQQHIPVPVPMLNGAFQAQQQALQQQAAQAQAQAQVQAQVQGQMGQQMGGVGGRPVGLEQGNLPPMLGNLAALMPLGPSGGGIQVVNQSDNPQNPLPGPGQNPPPAREE